MKLLFVFRVYLFRAWPSRGLLLWNNRIKIYKRRLNIGWQKRFSVWWIINIQAKQNVQRNFKQKLENRCETNETNKSPCDQRPKKNNERLPRGSSSVYRTQTFFYKVSPSRKIYEISASQIAEAMSCVCFNQMEPNGFFTPTQFVNFMPKNVFWGGAWAPELT